MTERTLRDQIERLPRYEPEGEPNHHNGAAWMAQDDAGDWIKRDDALSALDAHTAAREAAAAMAMREAAAREIDCEGCGGKCYDAANCWQSAAADIRALPLPDTSALDRLIAERVREALIEVRDLIAERRNAQEPGPIFGAYNEAMGDVEDVRCRRARGSKEGADGMAEH